MYLNYCNFSDLFQPLEVSYDNEISENGKKISLSVR